MGHELPSVPRDFGFTDDHQLLIQTVRRFVAERFTAADLRALYDTGARDASLHRAIAELGILDGTSLGYLGSALVCEELGRALFPSPVAGAILAADLCARGGLEEEAASIIGGHTVAHVALDGDDVRGAPCGAGLLLMPAGGTSWSSARLDDVAFEEEHTVDRTRDGLRFDASVSRGQATAFEGGLTREDALARALTLLAAESCGAADSALRLTRVYACDRQQFGRPIGTFQAVSHPLVNTMIAVEQAKSLTAAAAAALDGGQPALTLARMAKAAASDALRDAAARGVQLHGGFGFTWDCDMHFYFRRALHDFAVLGTPAQHRRELFDTLMK